MNKYEKEGKYNNNDHKNEKNPDFAYLVNAIGARNLAMEAEDRECKLIQISTDDVFDGKEPCMHTEFDYINPRSVYGKSKFAGEQLVRSLYLFCIVVSAMEKEVF